VNLVMILSEIVRWKWKTTTRSLSNFWVSQHLVRTRDRKAQNSCWHLQERRESRGLCWHYSF